jgi:hypothetical protein
MGKSSGSQPAAPNPATTIAAQSQANKDAVVESARVNAIDQVGPTGRVTYHRRADGTPDQVTTTLSDQAQNAYDTQQRITNNLAHTAENRIQGIAQDRYTNDGLPYNPATTDLSGYHQYQGGNAMRRTSSPTADALRSTSSSSEGGMVGPTEAPEKTRRMDRPVSRMAQPVQDPNSDRGSTGGASVNNAPAFEGARSADQMNSSNRARGGAFGTDGLPYRPGEHGDLSQHSNRVGDSLYSQATSRMDPQWASRERSFEQSMSNKGIPVGSEAYRDARQQFDQGRNDAYSTANNAAIQASGAEQSRLIGLEQGQNDQAYRQASGTYGINANERNAAFGRDATQFGINQQSKNSQFGRDMAVQNTEFSQNVAEHQQGNNDFRQRIGLEQGIRQGAQADRLGERNQTINEISAILRGSPAIGMPQTPGNSQYNVAPVDVAGITQNNYNNQMQAYNAEQNRNNSMWQGAFGVASAGMPWMMKKIFE